MHLGGLRGDGARVLYTTYSGIEEQLASDARAPGVLSYFSHPLQGPLFWHVFLILLEPTRSSHLGLGDPLSCVLHVHVGSDVSLYKFGHRSKGQGGLMLLATLEGLIDSGDYISLASLT